MASGKEKGEEVGLQRIDVQSLIQTALEKDSNIEILERLFELQKNVRDQQAKEAWNHAMARFQAECPPIKKTATAKISTRGGGSFDYSYAPLGDIMAIVQPVMGPLGLHVSFRVSYEKGLAIANCRVSHEFGHFEESGNVAMPVDDSSGMGANPAQRVGIAQSYAKRYAAAAVLGISPEEDPDAKGTGSASVQQPRRQGEVPADDSGPERGNWVGTIKDVKQKKGKKKDGSEWTLYVVNCNDGSSFGTFDTGNAEFAMGRGKLPVLIDWELTDKKNKTILGISPYEQPKD